MDKTTKQLLLAIALGLWANVVSDWIRPSPVIAQGVVETQVIRQNQQDVHVIAAVICLNSKIC